MVQLHGENFRGAGVLERRRRNGEEAGKGMGRDIIPSCGLVPGLCLGDTSRKGGESKAAAYAVTWRRCSERSRSRRGGLQVTDQLGGAVKGVEG